MPTAYRVAAVWGGFQGAPGYSKFTFMDLVDDTSRNAAGAAVRAFFFAVKQYMDTTWTISVQPNIQGFDMASGTLTSETSMTTTPAVVSGAGPATTWAGGSGYVISWRTGGIFNGRRLQGRTFMVPALAVFETNGTLTSTVIADATAAGNALIAASGAQFAIWGKQYSTVDPKLQIGGALFPVESCTVKDMAAQLRSRRL